MRTAASEALERFGISLTEMLAWIRDVVSEPEVDGRVLNDKGWSVVVHFGVAVIKVTKAGMFPDGVRMFDLVSRTAPKMAPQLVAWRFDESSGHQQMMFLPFGGVSIDRLDISVRKKGLVEIARTTARIQARVKAANAHGLVTVRAADVPLMLDELLEGALPKCRTDYVLRWSDECTKQNISVELAEMLTPWRSAVADWADELESSGWSNSIDHVDLLPHNANLLQDGKCIVYDWEQSTLGVPMFSLDVLLAYAQSINEGADNLELRPENSSSTQKRMRTAYLEELNAPLDLALRLAPIRYCWSEWRQAEAADVSHYGVDDVAWWLTRALRRWEDSFRRGDSTA